MVASTTGLHDQTLGSSVSSAPACSLDSVGVGLDHTSSVPAGRRSSTLWFQTLVTRCEVSADFFAVTLGVVLAYGSYRWLHLGTHPAYPLSEIVGVAGTVAALYVMMLKANGAYHDACSLLRVRETERVLAVAVRLTLAGFVISFLTELSPPRSVFILALVLVPMLVMSEKQAIYWVVRTLHGYGYGVRRAVIYGAGMNGSRTFSVLARSPKLGLDPVGIVDDDPESVGKKVYESAYTRRRCLEVIPGPLTAALLRDLTAEVVIIATPSVTAEEVEKIGMQTAAAGATLSLVPHDSVTSYYAMSYANADGLMIATVGEQAATGSYRYTKRAFDFTAALLLLLLASPALLLMAAIIRLTSPGPALFLQNRVGRNGRIFKLYKFRTMYVDAPAYAYSPKSSRDPRITAIGAFLRRTSLDEVVQLINVLKGDMSLVGPRPEMPFIVEQYNELHRQRLRVEQGITGLWQISADRAHLIHENIQYDLYYVRHRNFFMDLAILLHTIAFAMRGV
jgi:exopolysaccharide biosynthesis polyprenyl glycosylphosphotransferase